jgi:hypothetical protein
MRSRHVLIKCGSQLRFVADKRQTGFLSNAAPAVSRENHYLLKTQTKDGTYLVM